MEPIRQAAVITLDDTSKVAVARRAALEAGHRLGLEDDLVARAELVAVELANNILQHAGPSAEGRIFVSSNLAGAAVQIVAADKGRGIPNVARSMEDGVSSASTPGLGLGAVSRLARNIDIFSVLGGGTVISATIGPTSPPPAPGLHPALGDTAVLSTPLPGELVNGDSWAVAPVENRTLICVVDGLGHGLHASEAAAMAIRIFLGATDRPLGAILDQMHGPMRATRGAAALLLSIEYQGRKITSCGVGNVSCRIQSREGRSQSVVSHNGTVGHTMHRTQEFHYTYGPDTLLIVHTDGIATHWSFDRYPGLHKNAAATVAGVLYRDAWRGRDDATILVGRLA